jgi:hypothetical protein
VAAKIKTFTRAQNAEALINEGNNLISRDQVLLQADPAGYPPNCLVAKITGGANAGQWGRYDPAGANGLNGKPAYLFESRGPSTGTQRAAIVSRNAELNGKKLNWNGITGPQIAAAIALMLTFDVAMNTGGIRVRY